MTSGNAAAAGAEIQEIDRIAGYPHPRETAKLFGHGEAETALLEGIRSGRLHHAWLIAGPRGIGKATLAYRLARFLLSRECVETASEARGLAVPPQSAVFRQVAGLAHPDLLVLRRPWSAQRKRHSAAITVDEARRLRPFLGQTAASGGWRVVVIDAADDLNIAAANAVLKSLEEPPPACVFLLVSAAPGRLPVTVRSRCRLLRLSPLEAHDLRAAVSDAISAAGEEAPDEGTLKTCIQLAQGSPGAVLRLLAEDGADLYRRLLAIVSRLPEADYTAIHDLADALAAQGAEGRCELFHAMLGDLLARLVALAAGGGPAGGALADEEALARRLIPPAGLAHWAGVWETLQRAKAEADVLNLDRKTLVLGTFFRLAEAARRTMAR